MDGLWTYIMAHFLIITLCHLPAIRTEDAFSTIAPYRIPVGGSCGPDNGCVLNAFCSSLSKTCQCIESEYYLSGTVCVQKPSYGENCTVDIGCLGSNSQCSDRLMCTCKDNYYFAGTQCKTVPGPVLNLTVTHNNTHICSTWILPEPYPGPVNYNVFLVDNVNNNIKIFKPRIPESHICQRQSYLFAFWEYKFEVTAFTRSGYGETRISETVITNRRDPVVQFKVINADGKCCRSSGCGNRRSNDYRHLVINWKDPDPRERGTRLTRYVIKVEDITHGGVRNVTERVPSELINADDRTYRRTPSSEHSVPINVTPGDEYSFKFWTLGEMNVVVIEPETNCKAPIGKPPSWDSSQGNPPLVNSSDKTLTIQFSQPVFFNNDSNGQITRSGLIVSKRFMRVSDADNIKSSWGPQEVMYRIGSPGSTINSQDGRITIGADGDCSDIPFTSIERYYCNGELQPETNYYILVFVCSERGCVQSPILGPYQTASVDMTVTIVAAVIGVAVLVGVAVVIVVLLWKYRNRKRQEDDYVLTVTPMYQDVPRRDEMPNENVEDEEHVYVEIV